MAELKEEPTAEDIWKMEYLSDPTKCPVVYSPEYNIKIFGGIEKYFHAFDSGKWGKAYAKLIESGQVSNENTYAPLEVLRIDLLRIHSPDYLASLANSRQVSQILEVPSLSVAQSILKCFHIDLIGRILRSMRFQTGGTILAACFAINRGWAINIGGGFHHASGHQGGGFCVYADISIAIRAMLDERYIQKAMIVDLDAHQGNGHEMDFRFNSNVYIMDMYNADIYPDDRVAMYAIRKEVKLRSGTGDAEYLSLLIENLASALEEFAPQLIVYNAGTDLLAGDPLGRLNISAKAVVERDEIVFRFARQRQIPIVMVTSGGYTAQSAGLIADSILNLNAKGLIQLR